MEKPRLSQKPRVFYGYRVVVATFFCLFVSSGVGFFAFGLFVKPLQADFGWGRGGIMVAFTIFYLVQGGTAPYVGRLVDRYGASKVIAIGAFIAGLGFILLSLMYDLWYFYVGYSIIAAGMSAMSTVPATAAVSNWFKKRRGLAIGITSTGMGGGGFVMAPLIGGYLIPNFGWRVSYLALAFIIWVLIIPIALLVIKTKPEDMGLYPDGGQAPEVVAEAKTSLSGTTGLNLKTASASLGFWLIAISFLLNQFSHVGTIQSQVPHLEDIGFPLTMAATALGGVGLASAVGKFGSGWLSDRIQAKYACAIGLALQFIGISLLMSVGPASPPALMWLYAIIMGLGVGSWLPAMSMITSTNFGLASYGTIFGVVTLFNNIGAASGPLMAGFIYDTTNTYQWAFIIFLALYAVSIPSILAVRRPKSLEQRIGEEAGKAAGFTDA